MTIDVQRQVTTLTTRKLSKQRRYHTNGILSIKRQLFHANSSHLGALAPHRKHNDYKNINALYKKPRLPDETRESLNRMCLALMLQTPMANKCMSDAVIHMLQQRGLEEQVIEPLLDTTYRIFDVKCIYQNFIYKLINVKQDDVWKTARIVKFHIFDGFGVVFDNREDADVVQVGHESLWVWP